MDTLYCTNCGSTNVSYQTWFSPNSKKVDEDLPDLSDEDNCWCDDGEEHYPLANLAGLWEMFNGLVENGVLKERFLSFPKGTAVDKVKEWFIERCPNQDISEFES